MTSNVIYAGEVIYEATSSLAYPGPRGAQRHREIRGPDMKCREAAQHFFEELGPGSSRRRAGARPGHEAVQRHL